MLEERIKVLIMPLTMLLLYVNINSCESCTSHNHAGTSSCLYVSSNNVYNNHLRNIIMHDVNNNNIIRFSMKHKIDRIRRTTTKILN